MSDRTMRAKMRVGSVFPYRSSETNETVSEQVTMHGVSANGYPADGSDENNTFAKFSPSVNLQIIIANPALFGQLKAGDTFYVDFTRTDQ